MSMNTTEALNANNKLVNDNYQSVTQQNEYAQTQAVASQAADLAKKGDYTSAYQLLMKAAPSQAASFLPQIEKIDPKLAASLSQGQKMGQLNADAAYGQLPTQVQAAKAAAVKGSGFIAQNFEAPDGSVIKVAMDKKTGKLYDFNGEPYTGDQLKALGNKAGFAPGIVVNPNTKGHEVISKGGVTKDVAESGAVVEQDADGHAVALNPKQQDGLIKETDSWNKDKTNQEMISQINSLDKAQKAIINNAPGGQILEQMRLIRGMSPRPAVQEVMALNKGAGWQTTLGNYISEAEGKGMSPQLQKNMLSMINLFQQANLDEYNSLIHSRAAQTGANYKVDPSIVMGRFAPSLPTPIQENLQKLNQASPRDKEAVDWAHKELLKDPRNENALKILQLHGL